MKKLFVCFITGCAIVTAGLAQGGKIAGERAEEQCHLNCEIPRIIGHRGALLEYDDNAIGGFKLALEAGVTGFETDLRFTADGDIILMHDNKSDRTTTTVGAEVEKMTLAECMKLRLKKSGENVPSLQQLVQVFKGRKDIFVEFEMKSAPADAERMDAFCRKSHDIVSSVMPKETYAFTSFNMKVLRTMRRLYPDVNVGLITSKLKSKQLEFAKEIKAMRIAPLFGSDPALIKQARDMGFEVTLWIVDKEKDYEKAKAMGATAVTSNHPMRLLKSRR